MRLIPLLAAGLIAASPAAAHDDHGNPLFPSEEQLKDLGRLAEGWLRDLTEEVTPMMEQLMGVIDDASQYEPPEMLPNGDIIIRRRPDPAPEAPKPDPEDAIDL